MSNAFGPGSAAQEQARAAQLLGKFKTSNKYYSLARFQAVATTVALVTTYTFAAGAERRLFDYKIGDAIPGTLPAIAATLADTNLTKAANTNGGETVEIYGLSLILTAESEIFIAKLAWDKISVEFSLNGGNNPFQVGTPEMIPCGGGLTGEGNSLVQTPPLPDEFQARSGTSTNGLAMAGNFLPLPFPIVWTPSNEDSQLVILLTLRRGFTFTATARAAAAGTTAAFTPPITNDGARGTFIDIKAHLWSHQVGVRSQNR